MLLGLTRLLLLTYMDVILLPYAHQRTQLDSIAELRGTFFRLLAVPSLKPICYIPERRLCVEPLTNPADSSVDKQIACDI